MYSINMDCIKREISITTQILLSLIVRPWMRLFSGPKDFFGFQVIFFLGMTFSLQVRNFQLNLLQ